MTTHSISRGIRRATFWGLLLGSVSIAAAIPAVSSNDPNDAPELVIGLEQVLIRIPSKSPGYLADAAQGSRLQGVYELNCWLALAEPPWIRSTEPLSAKGPLGGEPFDTLHRLLEAYADRDVESVLELYEPRSQAVVRERLADSEFEGAWLNAVSRVVGFQPLVLWEQGDEYHCQMRLRAREDSGAESTSMFAVIFNRAGLLRAGEMSTPMHANLSRFLAPESARVEALIVNYGFVERNTQGNIKRSDHEE